MMKFAISALLLLVMVPAQAETTMSKTVDMELVSDYIDFTDDLDFENMLLAIKRQEVYFNRRNLNVSMKFGKRTIKRSHLKASLAKFKDLVIKTQTCVQNSADKTQCYKKLSKELNTIYEVYRPLPLETERGYQDKKTLFTAYYSPDFEGSKVKTDVYKHPIYAKPKDERLRKATSDQINFENVLAGKGLELFYVKESLYDIWLLHVEGGGRVKVKMEDGSYKKFYLSYDGANGRSFAMLWRYMISQGMLQSGGTSIENQRRYFIENPQDQRAILASCPSFIWFKVTEDEPLGVHNMPLTSNRSLATDYRRMQEYGVINFVRYTKSAEASITNKPVELSRFFLNQDTGGAIRGNARSDLYFGFGVAAERAANNVYGLGQQYFLILK